MWIALHIVFSKTDPTMGWFSLCALSISEPNNVWVCHLDTPHPIFLHVSTTFKQSLIIIFRTSMAQHYINKIWPLHVLPLLRQQTETVFNKTMPFCTEHLCLWAACFLLSRHVPHSLHIQTCGKLTWFTLIQCQCDRFWAPVPTYAGIGGYIGWMFRSTCVFRPDGVPHLTAMGSSMCLHYQLCCPLDFI